MKSVMADTDNEVDSRPFLNGEEQQLVHAFRGFGGRPTLLPTVPAICSQAGFLLLEVVTEQYQPSILTNPLVAAFHCPTPDRVDSQKYF